MMTKELQLQKLFFSIATTVQAIISKTGVHEL